MTVAQEIEQILRNALDIESLEIVNESASHHGHAGDNGSGESHFRVMVCSRSFQGMNRVAQHQQIYNLLSELLKNKVHALALETKIPA